MSHQVYIDRCKDAVPNASRRLAEAIARRYGIDAAQILSRLERGRFQVKSKLDLPSARTFAAWLEEQGAVCSVCDAAGNVVYQSQKEQPAETEPDASLSLLTPPPPSDYESGLSAAYEGASEQDLGALQTGSAALTLATLDGNTDRPGAEGSAKSAPPTATDDASAFLPPDMKKEAELQLDTEEVVTPAPQPVPDESPPRTEARTSDLDQLAVEPEVSASANVPIQVAFVHAMAESERKRWIAAVVLAVVIGFVAVHFVGASLEASNYDQVVGNLSEEYRDVQSGLDWEGLAESRALAAESLASKRTNLVVTCALVWLLLGAGIIVVWTRVIKWAQLAKKYS